MKVTASLPVKIPEFPDTPEREKPKKPTGRVVKSNGSLYTALLQAQKDVKDVEKDATNTYHKYAYVSAEAILKEARRVLLPNGLIVLRHRWWFDSNSHDFGKDCPMLVFVCELRHVASGESKSDEVIFPAIITPGRPLDKAIAAALTSGLAYWLRDQLQIPRVDASMDNRDDSKFDPSKAKGAEPVQEPKEPPRWKGTNAAGVVGVPKPLAQPLPEARKDRKPASTGQRLGPVTDEYWALKRLAEDQTGTLEQATRDRMKGLMPDPAARYHKVGKVWEWYLPADKAEAAEVSVGAMFGDVPDSDIPF